MPPMAVDVTRHRFTIDHYERMHATGILTERDRVELVRGEIVAMAPSSIRHAGICNRITHALTARLGAHAVIAVGTPVALAGASSVPRPDHAVLKRRASFYADRRPELGDTLLVVEVMDGSARYDRRVKVPLYARAGVPETWLVDIPEMTIEVLRQPRAGLYEMVRTVGGGDAVAPLAFPDVVFSVDDLLG
jgi:Uma2 family endonuclease